MPEPHGLDCVDMQQKPHLCSMILKLHVSELSRSSVKHDDGGI
jgi:hypothetical protein